MKLANLLEAYVGLTAAKKLALRLQQLAVEHNFEYELDYRPAMHVGTVNKVQAIELTLPSRQVKEISDAVKAECVFDKSIYEKVLDKLAAFVVIGEHSATMHVFNAVEDPVDEYVDDDIEELVKKHIAPFSQYTKLT